METASLPPKSSVLYSGVPTQSEDVINTKNDNNIQMELQPLTVMHEEGEQGKNESNETTTINTEVAEFKSTSNKNDGNNFKHDDEDNSKYALMQVMTDTTEEYPNTDKGNNPCTKPVQKDKASTREKDMVQETLTSMGYESEYIVRALEIYERDYGQSQNEPVNNSDKNEAKNFEDVEDRSDNGLLGEHREETRIEVMTEIIQRLQSMDRDQHRVNKESNHINIGIHLTEQDFMKTMEICNVYESLEPTDLKKIFPSLLAKLLVSYEIKEKINLNTETKNRLLDKQCDAQNIESNISKWTSSMTQNKIQYHFEIRECLESFNNAIVPSIIDDLYTIAIDFTLASESNEIEPLQFDQQPSEQKSSMPLFESHMQYQDAIKLKVYGKVDHRAKTGYFVYSTVADKFGTDLKIHYDGWQNNWDTWSDFKKEIHRFAHPGSISRRPAHRLKHLKKGDSVYINPRNKHPGWKRGEIRRFCERSGQIQVAYGKSVDGNYLYWTHLDNKYEIAEFASRAKKNGGNNFRDDEDALMQEQRADKLFGGSSTSTTETWRLIGIYGGSVLCCLVVIAFILWVYINSTSNSGSQSETASSFTLQPTMRPSSRFTPTSPIRRSPTPSPYPTYPTYQPDESGESIGGSIVAIILGIVVLCCIGGCIFALVASGSRGFRLDCFRGCPF